MVSASKLLQVLVRRFETPQPDFMVGHAHFVLKFLSAICQTNISREDMLNVTNIITNCPHALPIFKGNQRLCERLLLSCFASVSRVDAELQDGVRHVICTLSVNPELNSNIMMTMARKTVAAKRVEGAVAKQVLDRDDAISNELLRRVVAQMPAHGDLIPDGGVEIALLPQKAMHKRRQERFERPELFFLVSTLRCIATHRQSRLRDSFVEAGCSAVGMQHRNLQFLPADVVDPVVRCVTSLPAFCNPEAPMRPDDWYLLASLIACPDARLRPLGIRLWAQKVCYYDPLEMNLTEVNSPFPLTIAGFLVSMRGEFKEEAMMLWLGVVTDPAALPLIDERVLQLLLFDIAQYAQVNDMNDVKREQILVAQLAVLKALEDSMSPIYYLDARMTLTRTTKLLNTSSDLIKTLSSLKDVLSTGQILRASFLRSATDFLRYVRQTANVNEQSYIRVLILLMGNVLHAIRVLSVQEYTSVCIVVLATIVGFLRDVQPKASSPQGDEWCELLKALATTIMNEKSLVDPNIVSLQLHMMELLDFASDEHYSTSVRERILASLRTVSTKTQEIAPTSAQHCYELLLRAVHFHVLDEELLSEAVAALRHATDTTVAIECMNWSQRRHLIDRCSTLYREIAPMFPSSRGARRLGKQMLTVATIITTEKHAPRTQLQRRSYDARRPVLDSGSMQFCAQAMWSLALRATLSPIPHLPVDRYLAAMLRFAKKHWRRDEAPSGYSSEKSLTEEAQVTTKTPLAEPRGGRTRVSCGDERFCSDIANLLLPLLNQVLLLWYTNRTAFQANQRRHKAVVSTACDIIERNSAFLSPRVWFDTQRVLSNLPIVLPNQCTPLHLSVLRRSLQETLRNVRACGNQGTWHLPSEKTQLKAQEGSTEAILGGRMIADMFGCANIIEDADLKVYLISLASEQLKMISDLDEMDEKALTPEEKSRLMCLNKIVSSVRHGTVLYY
ncbi:hypothetical protein, conserved [Trypanosoma brucei brucei TREU927]|uniref:Uncharacterized protein n=1 Tax=Trypanosoma brucei brucei (strain 927/4 GUTat10.1) TaxID=185431 RepID=Q38A46_TRYB2|nr:hypothetical protein, conserved [Trypanosoma brucei brucei TREU927]EAN78324.1 hypothetical protein, conserved [Trypanosoma brucei brucei TREU927]